MTFKPAVSLVTGGTDGGSHPRIARWLSRGFERLGEPFDAVHVERPRSIEREGVTRIVRLGVTRLRWSCFSLASYLRTERPGFVLATPIEVAVTALAVARLAGSHIVPWEQTMARIHVGDHPKRFRALPALERLTYPSAPMIAGTSQDVVADLFEHFGERIPRDRLVVLPNPIDADEIRRLALPAAQSGSTFRFCAVGRLTRQKGYDVLLQAAAVAAPRIKREWELLVCGTGPLLNELQRVAQQLGISDRVQFLGFVANPYPLIASSNAFVHAARWEGFGLVVAEALALGVPVVATSCPGGPREILENGRYGLLVPSEDPLALADALVRMTEDDALLSDLSEIGPERVSHYAPERVAAEVLELVERQS